MKEQYRDKRFNKSIKITLSDGNVWKANTYHVLNSSIDLVEHYQGMGIKMTLRQLYYRLVATSVIPNDIKIYSKLSSLITDARYAGFIDWDAIEDLGRIPSISSEWDNIAGLVDTALRVYRMPRWSDQDNYVELFTEKQALSSILSPIADKYHLPFCVNKGYGSATALYSLYNRIRIKIKDGKFPIVLYLGDHDPSGLDMIRDIKDRLEEFFEYDREYFADNYPYFEIIPIALTADQINEFNPPPNPAKIKDPRAKWYIQKFGKQSWEVDALKPDIMIDIVSRAIEMNMDVNKYNNWIKKEEQDKIRLKKLAKDIK